MRDEAPINDILRLLHGLWVRSDTATVCGLVYSAVDPAVPNEIRGTSDATLLQQLRAMAFHGSGEAASPDLVDAERLAALDEARDYGAASSYNWLNAELDRLRAVIRGGGVVRVEDESPPTVLPTLAAFTEWAGRRYPHARQIEPFSGPHDLNDNGNPDCRS